MPPPPIRYIYVGCLNRIVYSRRRILLSRLEHSPQVKIWIRLLYCALSLSVEPCSSRLSFASALISFHSNELNNCFLQRIKREKKSKHTI